MFGLSKNRFIDIKKATIFVFSYFIAYRGTCYEMWFALFTRRENVNFRKLKLKPPE